MQAIPYALGAYRPFAWWTSAAVQLHHSGHSCIVQHFQRVKVVRADFAAVRCRSLISCFADAAFEREGGNRTFAAGASQSDRCTTVDIQATKKPVFLCTAAR